MWAVCRFTNTLSAVPCCRWWLYTAHPKHMYSYGTADLHLRPLIAQDRAEGSSDTHA